MPRRTRRFVLIGLAAIVFLAISGLLARYLTAENAERNAVHKLLIAQGRGDADAMARSIAGCSARAACREQMRALARRLRRPGDVKILNLDSDTSHSLKSATGLTRVAWNVPDRLPVVQCILVRRKGNPVTGTSITLLSLSAPIARTGGCD